MSTGFRMLPTAESATTGRKIKKAEFAGKGALIQFIGVICLFIYFPFGVIVGLLLLVIGGFMAFTYRCSECGNRVEKESRLCPHCHTRFE